MSSLGSLPSVPGKHRPPRRASKARIAERDRIKTRNRARFREQKKKDKVSEANRVALIARADLKEIRELAKTLRPFLENGAILLGETWDSLMADQVTVALTGTQRRIVFDKNGDPILDDKGEPAMQPVSVSAAAQISARQKLIELFPKLIPEDTSAPDTDPLAELWRRMNSEGGRMAIEIDGETDPNEPEDNVVDGIARVIDDDGPAEIDLTAQNA